MEISPLMIYIIGLVDKLQRMFETQIFLGLLAAPILFILSLAGDDRSEVVIKRFYFWFRCTLIAIIISVVGLTSIPTSKTLIAMYVIPPVANSQVLKEIPDVLLDFVKAYVGNLKKEDDV